MHRKCRERFPRHRLQRKQLAIPACITARASHTYRDACWDRGGGENVPGIPGSCATRNFTYLARGPCRVSLNGTFHQDS